MSAGDVMRRLGVGLLLATLIGCGSSSGSGAGPAGPVAFDGGFQADAPDTATCRSGYGSADGRDIAWAIQPGNAYIKALEANDTATATTFPDGRVGFVVKWGCTKFNCDHPRDITLAVVPDQIPPTTWYVASEQYVDRARCTSGGGTTGSGSTGGGTTGGVASTSTSTTTTGNSCRDQGASCGCSGYRKSECGGACCRWTVGQGCGCN